MIIADTGFWVALLFRRDRHHAAAVRAHAAWQGQLITTWPVLTETCHLLGRHVDPDAPAALLEQAGRGFTLWELPTAAGLHAATLMRRYQGQPMDLADASLVLLAEHLGSGRILSTDRRDFDAYRWNQRLPFENLLLAETAPRA